MDDGGLTFVVPLGADGRAAQNAEIVLRVAEESCRDEVDDAGSFVTIHTDMREGELVKTVVFESIEAAQRFLELLRLVEPRLAARG